MLLPTEYVYVVNMLCIHTYLKPGVQYGADLLLRPPRSRVFFSMQPFLKYCLMPHWHFFSLQTSKWAKAQHPSVCLYSIFPSLLWENSLVSPWVSLSAKASSQPGWVFNSFIPPSSMNKLLSGQAKEELLCLPSPFTFHSSFSLSFVFVANCFPITFFTHFFNVS